MKKNKYIFFIVLIVGQVFSLYAQESSSINYSLKSSFTNNFTSVQASSGSSIVNSVGENFSLSIAKSNNFQLLSGIIPIRLMPVATIYNTPSRDSSRKMMQLPIALLSQCQGSETFLLAEGGGGYIFSGSDSSKGYIWNTGAIANSVKVYPLGDSVIKVQAQWGDLSKDYSFLSLPDSVMLSTIKLKANFKLKDLSKNPESETIGNSSIDLILESDSNLAICNPDEIRYTLKFNRTLFKPISNPTSYSVLSDSIAGNYRYYRIKKSLTDVAFKSGMNLASIKGTILLGNSEIDSALFITKDVLPQLQNYTKFYSDGGKTFNVEWFKNGSPYFVDTKVKSGNIKLDSLCVTKNGKRLLDWPPPIQTYLKIISISPNPTDLMARIEFETNSKSEIKLSIFSISGDLVESKVLQADTQLQFADLAPDEVANLTASVNFQHLNNGVYFVMLSSNGSNASKYLIISH